MLPARARRARLAAVIRQRQLVGETPEIICRRPERGWRVTRRVQEPPAFQLLLNLREGGLTGQTGQDHHRQAGILRAISYLDANGRLRHCGQVAT